MQTLPAPAVTVTPTRYRGSWLRDSSVTAKLVTIVAVNITIMLALLAIMVLSLNIASGIRAYVGGEGIWSKGQKDAVYYLSRYADTRDPADYQAYQRAIDITLGDKKARLEMLKPDYDYAVVEQGFVEGGNSANDVPNMILLFRHFGQVSYMARAIAIWTQADESIAGIIAFADELHTAVQAGQLSSSRERALRAELEQINAEVTQLERDFSSTLGEGARWIQSVLQWVVLGSTALLLLSGLWLSFRIARELRDGILRLREGAAQVASGNLTHRIKATSQDELGQLAVAFNDMVEHRQAAELQLETRMDDLARSNTELEQFAYAASHDLQEPLRTVTGFTQLLLKKFEQNADKDTQEFSAYIVDAVQRMRAMIDGLLAYSRLSRQDAAAEETDLNQLLDNVKADLATVITESKARITHDRLPTVMANKTLIQHVLQNLISNALKFCSKNAPRIHIRAQRQNGKWQVSVRDHGIGIAPEHAERIFVIFQRLHTRDQYTGNGIGLTLCKKIIEQGGGRIWVEPASPGSIFHFTLPA